MSKENHLAYRPDIDGLRAIAVLSVVMFHASPGRLPGGFIGVDIFFVISGYLISSILLKELAHGNFSIREFYSRRARRIFPALLAVLVPLIPLGALLLFPTEFANLGKHIGASAVFGSNLLLWNEAGYFDAAAETKPLLHLWSLGVEEQFYLLWPLLLAFVQGRRWSFLLFTSAVALLSFSLDVYLVRHHPTAAFYSPLARFWELAMGGVLAHLHQHHPEVAQRGKNLQAWAGALLLAAGLAGMNSELAFPAWWALPPTIGALLLLSAGSEAWFNRRILASRGMVWIGLISYPLYLWHWPLLSLGRILEGTTPSPRFRVGAVLASILLATLTYRFIEKPLRKRSPLKLTCALFGVGAIGIGIFLSNGFPERVRHPENLKSVRSWNPILPGTVDCTKEFSSLEYSFCAKHGDPTIAIVGDSHAGHLNSGFARSDDARLNQVIIMGAGSCQPTLGVEARPGCDIPLQSALRIIASSDKIRTVILSSYYDFMKASDAKERYLQGYKRTFDVLRQHGKRIVFLLDTPTMNFDPDRCVDRPYRAVINQDDEKTHCSTNIRDEAAIKASYRQFVQELQSENQNVEFIDIAPLFCDNKACYAMHEGLLQYGDNNHLSIYGSKRAAAYIGSILFPR